MRLPGFIYVVQMEGHDYFKIGRTSNVRRRMSELGIQLPCPYRVVMAHRVSDAVRAEKHLHEEFKHVRMNGEWFRLTPDHIKEIQADLLFIQADDLISRVVRALASDDELFPRRLQQYGKVIFRIGGRAERRLETYATMRHARCMAEAAESDVLESEFIA